MLCEHPGTYCASKKYPTGEPLPTDSSALHLPPDLLTTCPVLFGVFKKKPELKVNKAKGKQINLQ